MRHDAQKEWRLPVVGIHTPERAHCPASEHIGLPMSLGFETRHSIVGRQRFECPHPGMIVLVFNDEGRDETCLQCYFAAGETLATLEPFVVIVCLRRPLTAKRIFHTLDCQRGVKGGINGLPECLA